MMVASEAELAEAIVKATDDGLRIIGGGTRMPGEGRVLSAAGLRGVSIYEPGALTLVAGAGTPLAEVRELLAAEGQQLPFEPMDHRGLLGTSGTPTLGGMVAANVSGPRRVQAGACRDFLLGVRFVDGAGRVVKNGGRVMKNVTGTDLAKLMAGSFGTLGVLSEVSLKVLPRPEAQAVLLLGGLSDGRAVAALSAALGSPYGVTGAAHLPIGSDGTPVTTIRLEGFEKSLGYRIEKLREALAEFGDIMVETDSMRVADIWRGVRDVALFQGRDGDVWRLSVKPSDGPVAGAGLREALGAEVYYDWGGGLVWVLVPEGADVRAGLGGIKGHARIVRASAATRARLGVFPPQGPVLGRIAAGLRARFDPRAILNPGLMG